MALPPKYQRFAALLKIRQSPSQSDEEFMRMLDGLYRHKKLIREAVDWGVSVQFGMNDAALRLAILRRQSELLQQRGFVIGTKLKLGDRLVEITKIVVEKRPVPKITVHYWIISPWPKTNNQGRANHRSAAEVLKKGKLAR